MWHEQRALERALVVNASNEGNTGSIVLDHKTNGPHYQRTVVGLQVSISVPRVVPNDERKLHRFLKCAQMAKAPETIAITRAIA